MIITTTPTCMTDITACMGDITVCMGDIPECMAVTPECMVGTEDLTTQDRDTGVRTIGIEEWGQCTGINRVGCNYQNHNYSYIIERQNKNDGLHRLATYIYFSRDRYIG